MAMNHEVHTSHPALNLPLTTQSERRRVGTTTRTSPLLTRKKRMHPSRSIREFLPLLSHLTNSPGKSAATVSRRSWAKAASASSIWPTMNSCSDLSPSRCRTGACVPARRRRSLSDRSPHGRQSRSPEHRSCLRCRQHRGIPVLRRLEVHRGHRPCQRRSRTTGLAAREAAELVATMAEALHHAHRKGSCIGTSSPATSCSTATASRSWSISGWRSRRGHRPRAEVMPGRLPT